MEVIEIITIISNIGLRIRKEISNKNHLLFGCITCARVRVRLSRRQHSVTFTTADCIFIHRKVAKSSLNLEEMFTAEKESEHRNKGKKLKKKRAPNSLRLGRSLIN